jgi:hypothetical protein
VRWRTPTTSNKTLTRTNLSKRRKLDDKNCLFCNEQEDVRHLFFDCCIARWLWNELSEILEFPVGNDFESIGKMWLSSKRFKTVNVLTSASLWTIWKIRNEMCFQGLRPTWTGIVLRRLAGALMNWKLLHKEEDVQQLERWAKLQWEELGSDFSDGVTGVVLSNSLNVMSCSVSEKCIEPDTAGVG